MSHALLSPSSASQWLTCHPSARLQQRKEDTDSEYSLEGTLAHKLGELLIRYKIGRIDEETYSDALSIIMENQYYDESMLEYCDEYANFVVNQFAEAQTATPHAILELEKRIDLSDYIPESFGTVDVNISTDDMLYVTDFKFGKGIAVSAIDNKQGRVYALGSYNRYKLFFVPKKIKITIYQPRINNITSEVISVKELLEWAEKELKPKAKLAFEGKGDLVPGKHCKFCKVKARCKAFTSMNMELAKYADLEKIHLINDKTVEKIMKVTDMLSDFLKAFNEYVLKEALNGKRWEGFKLVEGRSNRKYKDVKKITKALIKAGFTKEQILTQPELLGITALTKVIKPKRFEALVSKYIVKPDGKPTLVTVDDTRPEINDVSKAKSVFKDFVE